MLALWPDVDPAVLDSGGLTVDAADSMVENVVGTLSLPMGLGLNFIINGEPLGTGALPAAELRQAVLRHTVEGARADL